MWWTLWRERLMALAGAGRRPGARIRLLLAGPGPMRVAYDQAVVHETYSLRARLLQRAARLVFKPVLHLTPITDRTIGVMRGLERVSAHRPRSRYVEPVKFELGGVRVESMTHRYGPSSDLTILYLHGGGFMSCGIESHRRICERLALKSGALVISVDYVQLPEGLVADSVQDAISAYAALLEIAAHPDKIVVAGDSAGGYLTMKVAELATRRGLQAPAALIGFSPLLSVDPGNPERAVARVARVNDAYIPGRRLAKIGRRWTPEGTAIEGCASPLDATAHISSPTFLVAVEDEFLRPETEAMAVLLAERGVEVETHLWRRQVHAFPVLGKALPESDMAIGLAADFARRAVGELVRAPITDPHSHHETISAELVPEDPAA